MKQSLLSGLAAAVLLSMSEPPVIAQSEGPTDIAGPWRFQTATFDGNCTMRGAIRFTPARAAETFSCALIVETNCRGTGDRLDEYWRVKQACSAKKTGDALRIKSRIEKVESATLFGRERPVSDLGGYSPDDFTLELTKPDEMRGRLHDDVRRVPTRMWREQEKVS